MSLLSIRISDALKEQLLDKRGQIGVDNISSVVRHLLIWALQHYDLGSDSTLLRQMAKHIVLTQCLVEHCVVEYIENGDEAKDKSYEKAGKMIADLFEKNSFSD